MAKIASAGNATMPREGHAGTAGCFKPNQRLSFGSLPTDVMLLIVEYCVGARVSSRTVDDNPRAKPPPSALYQLSLTSRDLRQICLPLLFREVRISDRSRICDRPPVRDVPRDETVYQHLSHVRRCPAILESIQILTVECVSIDPYHFDMPLALIRLINGLPNVKEIGLRLWHKGETFTLGLLESYVAHSSLDLSAPSVRNFWLNTGSSSHGSCTRFDLSFFARAFPNLEKIYLNNMDPPTTLKVIKELGSRSSFKCLMLDKDVPNPRPHHGIAQGWRVSDVEKIYLLAPKITYLALKGQLENLDLHAFVHIISHFRHLEYLDVTDEQIIEYSDLTGGYESDVDEDDVFDEMMEETCDHVMAHPLNEKRLDVARYYFRACKSLKRISIGRPLLDWTEVFDVKRKEGKDDFEVRLVDCSQSAKNVVQWDEDAWPAVMPSRVIG